jgi:integrase
MASLEKIGTKYRVVWREGGRDAPRRKSELFENKKEATAAKRRIEAQVASRKALGPGKMLSWEDLVIRYCASRVDRTTEAHRGDLEKSALALGIKHGWKNCSDVHPEQVTALGALATRYVRSLLHYAQDLGMIVDARAIAACKSRTPRRKPTDLLTHEAVADFQSKADAWAPADGLLVHLISRYGHRAQSLVGLRRQDLDLVNGTITLRIKSGDIHRHPLMPDTLKRCRDLLKEPGKPEDPVLIGHLDRAWESGLEAASWMGHTLGVGVLKLRRYAITYLLEAVNGDARTAASITGHRTPSLLLNVYARTSEARQTAALESLARQHQKTTPPADSAEGGVPMVSP